MESRGFSRPSLPRTVARRFPRSSNWRSGNRNSGSRACLETRSANPVAGARSTCPQLVVRRALRVVPASATVAEARGPDRGEARWDRANAQRSRSKDREPSREAARRWAAKNADYRLRYKFGMNREQWVQRFEAQDGLCYLCGEFLDVDGIAKIHVDHDHACCRGERSCGSCVRGLACFSCNVGISKFGESPERLRRVADNLEMANRRLRSGSGVPDLERVPSGSDAPHQQESQE